VTRSVRRKIVYEPVGDTEIGGTRGTPMNVDLRGSAGLIEAVVDLPRGSSRPLREAAAVAIVCHPHPLFGGTLQNKVTYRIARGLTRAGFATLRFNFRGVGRSAGEHDEGRGEADDVRTAMTFMLAEVPGAPLLLAGYSFGAHVASRVAVEDPRALGLLLAGPALRVSSFDHLLACAKPKWLLAAERDPFGEAPLVEQLVARMTPPVELTLFPGEEHAFSGSLPGVERRAEEVGRAFVAAHGPS